MLIDRQKYSRLELEVRLYSSSISAYLCMVLLIYHGNFSLFSRIPCAASLPDSIAAFSDPLNR